MDCGSDGMLPEYTSSKLFEWANNDSTTIISVEWKSLNTADNWDDNLDMNNITKWNGIGDWCAGYDVMC